MASIGGSNNSANTSYDSNKNYTAPLILMMGLFFMIGFITVLNDVLIPTMKEAFNFKQDEKWKVMLIQFCFFIAYGVMSIPAGNLIHKTGYKKGLGIALSIIGTGLLLFIPASIVQSYGFFLLALFIVGSGLAILQVAINPYVSALGAPETASSRINLTGTFNSTATAIGPILGAWLILDECVGTEERLSLVRMPYLLLACVIIGIGVLLFFLNLPKLSAEEDAKEDSSGSIWGFKHLLNGAAAIFFYVGAEVAIGSFLVIYLKDDFMVPEKLASALVAYYWSSAMIGRAIGSYATAKVKQEKALAFVAVVAIVLVLLSMLGFMYDINVNVPVLQMGNHCETHAFYINFPTVTVPLGVMCLVLVGLFNSVMWPIIFPLGIAKLGPYTSKGSGLMVTMVAGGAIIPLIQGAMADAMGYRYSFILCLLCYAFILFFAVKGSDTSYLDKRK